MAVHELFAYLRARDADAAIVFYKRAFEATARFRLVEPGGRISHAEPQLGPAVLLVSAECPEYGINAPYPEGPNTFVTHHTHVSPPPTTEQAPPPRPHQPP